MTWKENNGSLGRKKGKRIISKLKINYYHVAKKNLCFVSCLGRLFNTV